MTNTIRQTAEQARRYQQVVNEGGEGYNPYDEQHDNAVRAAADARMDELASRANELRAAWNAAVMSRSVNGQLRASDMPAIEKEVGATQNEMRLLKTRMGW